ncbi:MAG: alpha/beta hydrolase [Candidatus Thermoplasmatota archaeon]|jgi:pimeloyl-ACP methyl ester carboxylesterase|nr:alpha/beta hydrolase [Candidatus Thermoplasmatota archaeon]MCL5963819.1 alpha/beta hydrolase [Candidatus Thermoplasmatota archaeon]
MNEEIMYIEKDACRLRYRRTGNGKIAIILLHGIGASLEIWNPLTRLLADDYLLYSLDLPGHGETRFDESYMKDFFGDNSPFIKAIDMLVEHESINMPIIMGNSMGGGIAILYTSKRHSNMRSVILIDPLGMSRWIDIVHRISTISFIAKKFTEKEPTRNEIVKSLKSLYYTRDPDEWLIDITYKYFMDKYNREWYFRLLREGVNIRGVMIEKFIPLRTIFENTKIPKLIIWGEYDRLFRHEDGYQYSKKLKNCTFVTVEKAGHIPMVEYPEKTAEIIKNFIKSG